MLRTPRTEPGMFASDLCGCRWVEAPHGHGSPARADRVDGRHRRLPHFGADLLEPGSGLHAHALIARRLASTLIMRSARVPVAGRGQMARGRSVGGDLLQSVLDGGQPRLGLCRVGPATQGSGGSAYASGGWGGRLLRSAAVDAQRFWALVDDARGQVDDPADAVAVADRAIALLANRPREDIVAALRVQSDLMATAYTRTMWVAADEINSECSDDGFEYFRAWLMTRGRDVFERAVADPDTLADLPAVRARATEDRPDSLECEEMLSIAWDAHIAATGEELPESAYTGGRRLELADDWDVDDPEELERRLPRLAALFGD